MGKWLELSCAAAFALAACPLVIAEPAYAADNELYLYNWPNYFPPEVLAAFEKETGIKTTIDTFDSNDTMIAKIQANPSAYDVAITSDYLVPMLAEKKLIQELNASAMPAYGNINEAFKSPPSDPGRKYSVPYMYGTYGFVYDTATIGGTKLDASWKEYFEPRQEFQGNLGSASDTDQIWGSATLYLGIDRCTVSNDDAKKILELLLKQKPFVTVYSNAGTVDRMIAGEVGMHSIANGAAHRVKVERKSVEYVFPKEGVELWADVAVIPAQATHAENAKKLLDYLMKPEVAAKLSNFTGFMNSIDGSLAYMDKALSEDPAVVPSKEAMALFHESLDCGAENRALRSKVWTQLMK